ncbi:unnamed protein product, partial [Cyprideis torosa]
MEMKQNAKKRPRPVDELTGHPVPKLRKYNPNEPLRTPLSALHEIVVLTKDSINYEVLEQTKAGSTVKALFRGQEFIGSGPNKKMAKQACAQAILMNVFPRDFDPRGVVLVPCDGEQVPEDFASDETGAAMTAELK